LTEGETERLCQCGRRVTGCGIEPVREVNGMQGMVTGGCTVAEVTSEDTDHAARIRVFEVCRQLVVKLEPAKQQQ